MKYPEDRINIFRSVLAPIVFFLPFFTGLPEGYELAAVAFIYFVIGDTNYILHLHIHNPFTRNKLINRSLDLILASVTGMTASNWRIQHLHNHHRGKDILFNGSKHWEIEKYTPLRALSYCFRSLWPTFWHPFSISARQCFSSNPTHFNYRWAFAEHCLLILFCAALYAANSQLFLFYILPLYTLTFFITRYVDYLNHFGCDETSGNIYEHSNNCLHTSFNRFTHNFGYHTAHHLKPGAHWTKLPELFAEIEDKIPDRCKKNYSWSWMLIPYHFYLSAKDKM